MKVFGYPYTKGSFSDMVLESFAGPHDMANSFWFYDKNGNGVDYSGDASWLRNFREYAANYNSSFIFAAPAIAEQTYYSSYRYINMIKNINYYQLFLMLFICPSVLGCVTNVINSSNIENNLNLMKGKRYKPPMYGWNKIYEDDVIFELERVHRNGCSYAITIDKKTNLIISGRFTSQKSKCDNSYVPNI